MQFIFVPYVYNIISSAIGANASVITPLLTDQDADFELHEIFAVSSQDDPSDIRPNNFSFQIQDKTNGRLWSDSLTPQAVAARIPGGWRMNRPVLMAQRSSLATTFTNLTAQTNTCTLSLVGVKVLQYSPGPGAPGRDVMSIYGQ